MKFFLAIFLLIPVSFILQEFIPVFDWAYGSRLLLVHTAFYAIAIAVPFPVMLLFALLTGFLWDARYHLPMYSVEGVPDGIAASELPFGFTIFLLGLTGAFIQGVRPLFRRGRWELPIFMIGLCTSIVLILEYLVLSFHRGALLIPGEFWWKVVMTSLFSALLSPLLLLSLSRLADQTRYRIETEGLKRRHTYDGDAI